MVGMPPPKTACSWSMTLENAEKFEPAMGNVPMPPDAIIMRGL